jgi:6-phosphogluconolactonase
MAREQLLDRVAIPRDQIRTILTAGLEPADSAEVAERHIIELFDAPPRPDIVLLGMADDGHTAALFNASSVLLEDEALFAATRQPSTDAAHVTATLPLLNAARNVVFLVAGATKAYAVKQNLDPSRDALVPPAGLVQPTNGKLTWLLDRDAAALLPHTLFTSE